ncbi:hypothetical protein HDV05_002966 [Chytridiales sp. JEL 0842]|nr:hypothetical protein HDV05_002966 [Chytridiales sp. JEL 0842]
MASSAQRVKFERPMLMATIVEAIQTQESSLRDQPFASNITEEIMQEKLRKVALEEPGGVKKEEADAVRPLTLGASIAPMKEKLVATVSEDVRSTEEEDVPCNSYDDKPKVPPLDTAETTREHLVIPEPQMSDNVAIEASSSDEIISEDVVAEGVTKAQRLDDAVDETSPLPVESPKLPTPESKPTFHVPSLHPPPPLASDHVHPKTEAVTKEE